MTAHFDDNGAAYQFDPIDCEPNELDELEDRLGNRLGHMALVVAGAVGVAAGIGLVGAWWAW